MASVLNISDGVTTIDFLGSDGTYRISSWTPSVAGLRSSSLGGRGPYNEVVEELEISIKGTNALASLNILRRLLEQSERWAKGEPVSPVFLNYRPGATTLKTLILGPAEFGQSMLQLPSNIVNAGAVKIIEPIVIRFLRQGLWLGASNTYSGSATTNPLPGVINSIPSLSASSPYVFRLFGILEQESVIYESFLLLTSGTDSTTSNRIQVSRANALADGTEFKTVVESGTSSVDGTVLEFKGLANTAYFSDLISLNSAIQDATRYAIFVNYRNQSSSATFKIRAGLLGESTRGLLYTPWFVVEPEASAEPRYAFLGTLSARGLNQGLALSAMSDISSAGIRFDSIVIMAIDRESDRVISILPRDDEITFTSANLAINHEVHSATESAIYVDTGTVKAYQSFLGDAFLTLPSGHTSLRYAWLGTGGGATDKWRATVDVGTAISAYPSISRTAAYLIPE